MGKKKKFPQYKRCPIDVCTHRNFKQHTTPTYEKLTLMECCYTVPIV